MNSLNKIYNYKLNGEHIFFFAYTVSLIVSFIINTTFMPFIQVKHLNWVNYLMFALLIVKIFIFDNINYKNYLFTIAVLLVAIISWRKTNNTLLMILIAFIVGSRNIEFAKIVKYYFRINLTMLLLVITYSILGVIENLVFYRDDIYRLSLGIDYPTDLAAYVFYLSLAYCYINYKRLNRRHYLILAFVSLITYIITNSRLDMIAILLIIPIIWMAKIVQNKSSHRNLRYIVQHYWALSLILPYIYILCTIYFNPANGILNKLNKLLSGRLAFGHIAIDKYGFTLFGHRITEHGWGGIKGLIMSHNNASQYFFIDSSYIRLAVIYGIIIGLIMVTFLVIISVRETINHEYVLPAIILLVMISSMIDQHMLELTYNVFILAFLANTDDNGGRINGKTIYN